MPKKIGDLVPADQIEGKILLIRGQKVMLDSDLAFLYGVETKALIQAVRRNQGRFPTDFMFQLVKEEFILLRSQIETSNLRSQSVTSRWGGRRYLPYAFTEQGVAMLSSVLKSPRAIMVNVEIMRTFVRLRRMLASHADLARKMDELEKKYDRQFAVVFEAIRQLMAPPPEPEPPPRKKIGFTAREKSEKYSFKRKM
ncbi:MAG: ORF6N domain-containing protein [Proteobacteria bacterium]|nr:ORF6N domain-containing protein [Pseudomonadota bacterium]